MHPARITLAAAMASLLILSTVATVMADPPNRGCGLGQELITVDDVRTSYLNAGAKPDPLEAFLEATDKNGDGWLCLVPARNPDASWWPAGFLNVVDNHAAAGD